MKRPPKNMAASVRDRLKILADQRGENFDAVLVRYGIERLLYRLSKSAFQNKFFLKGAMLFVVWEGALHRETRDLDLQGFGDGSVEGLSKQFGAIIATPVPDDGLEFLDVRGEPIQALQDYGGARLMVRARMTAARISIQVDVGFGSQITPSPKEVAFPTLLDFPAPRLRAYPVETVVAEKLQAIVDLGLRNSRLKDYFDLWYLGQTVQFNGALLARAILRTFAGRKTAFPEGDPVGLTTKFFDDEQRRTQWRAFLKRVDLRGRDIPFGDVLAFLREFLLPPLEAARDDGLFPGTWGKGGPWRMIAKSH